MKNILLATAFGATLLGVSCSKSDDKPNPGGGSNNGPGTDTSTNIFVRGTITTDQHWVKTKTYHLRGYVYVTSGATITIDPGTKIVSNKDSAGVLVIYRTAKINATGTAAEPIVFTSGEAGPKPGDLGGVILVGQAKGNTNHQFIEGGVDPQFSVFGGTNDADNSGTMKYVRIEYAGKAVNPGDEVNGLSLYGVGSGTTLDYIQVVRGLDDGFEFFGGTVNAKHLIAYNCADDDFDMDDGFSGNIQFAISVKDPGFTDDKGGSGDLSNNFEVDNVNPANSISYGKTPITYPVLSNFTAVGPNNAAGVKADYGYGMRWRRGCKFILANSIVMGGQKAGLDVEQDSTALYYSRGDSKFYNSFLHAVNNPFQVGGLAISPAVLDAATLQTITTTTNGSVLYPNATDIKLTDPFNNASPNLKPASGSPALTTPAKFDLTRLNVAFFDKVTYIGALDASNDWTAQWTVWNK
ncbi:MAG TPA: hypothetical protein VHE34_12785 [Puia sp.]|uniref:hypothetical protein n=1 Tax=Puia sp. TaxID=2045100 RepID=UPI002C39852C|nr:hypothetical protein [Puia sp.]HVU96099.1 hypothetical protein [Puia sp.]